MRKVVLITAVIFFLLAPASDVSAQSSGFEELLVKFRMWLATLQTPANKSMSPQPTWYPKQMIPADPSYSQNKPLLPVEENRMTKPMLPSQENRNSKPLLPTGDNRNTKPLLPAEENRPTKPLLPAEGNQNTKPLLPAEENPSKDTGGQPTEDKATAQRKNAAANLVGGFEKRLDNYRSFLSKVKSRRDKLSEAGQDVTKLNAFIATAGGNLEKAESTLTTAKTKFNGYDYANDPQTAKQGIKEELVPIRSAFTVLHKSMSEAVQEITVKSAQQLKGPPVKAGGSGKGTPILQPTKTSGSDGSKNGGNNK